MKKINKLTQKMLCVFFAFLTITTPFFYIFDVYAESANVLTISDDKVNVRTGPGTNSTSLGYLYAGTVITILDTFPTNDGTTGCTTDSWYKINYGGGIGYVCSKYATASYSDEYGRPWTTPKKALAGGAKYIAKNYIAKGQFTSYLKKFNVNPNSYYKVYTHQYMTNVRAPYSEALTAYNAYSKNGLLDQPLVFSIPIFNNVPEEYTALPGRNANTTGQDEITDTEFESLLDAQGFPETYRRKIRLLHNSYPNWVFEGLNTGLDWNASVAAERPISYIDGTDTSLREQDRNGNYILREGSNWYEANSATTAYFLDPRNFLIEERILMFEKLTYSDVHTETIIQTLLNSTFMTDLSPLDNQTYASIFVEAGVTANVSSIYLASLAIQESGINGSLATKGEQFTYKDITYTGLFNFFNIGAYSSESSPVRAGLVWANGGSLTTIVSGGNNTPIEIAYLNRFGLNKMSEYVTGIGVEKTVAAIKNRIPDATVNIISSSGKTLTDDERVGTGSKLVITDGETTYTNTIIIYGDISGDGAINAYDLLYIRKHLLKEYTLTGAYLEAAKIAKGNDVGAADLLYLRKHLLDRDTYKINQ